MRFARVVWLFALLASISGAWHVTEAAPDSNTFAGLYTGPVPGAFLPFSTTISRSGRISGSYYYLWENFFGGRAEGWGDLSGTVDGDGRMVLQVTEGYGRPPPGSGGSRSRIGTTSWTVSAQAALDAEGNIDAVTADGTSFTWTRQ